jgi:hypothetical protein
MATLDHHEIELVKKERRINLRVGASKYLSQITNPDVVWNVVSHCARPLQIHVPYFEASEEDSSADRRTRWRAHNDAANARLKRLLHYERCVQKELQDVKDRTAVQDRSDLDLNDADDGTTNAVRWRASHAGVPSPTLWQAARMVQLAEGQIGLPAVVYGSEETRTCCISLVESPPPAKGAANGVMSFGSREDPTASAAAWTFERVDAPLCSVVHAALKFETDMDTAVPENARLLRQWAKSHAEFVFKPELTDEAAVQDEYTKGCGPTEGLLWEHAARGVVEAASFLWAAGSIPGAMQLLEAWFTQLRDPLACTDGRLRRALDWTKGRALKVARDRAVAAQATRAAQAAEDAQRAATVAAAVEDAVGIGGTPPMTWRTSGDSPRLTARPASGCTGFSETKGRWSLSS